MSSRILHVLPHRGGGAETYIDLLEELDGFEHERIALSVGRGAAIGAATIAARYPIVVRRALAADVVHAHGDTAVAVALPLLVRRRSVWTTHGLHRVRRAQGRELGTMQSALRRAISNTARTICTSQAEHDELRALSPSERLVVVRNGIELPPATTEEQRAPARVQLGIRPDELAVLFLGELDQRKRPLDAVAAAERARDDGARVVLLVAGDGPQSAEVREHTGDAVRVLGQREDVPSLLAAADVLVMPSEREGLSFAVLEAMGAGLALVVSDGPGNPEAVGDAGIVLPIGDIGALAGTLSVLASDRKELARLGATARERVATTLTADALRAGVATAYGAALDDG